MTNQNKTAVLTNLLAFKFFDVGAMTHLFTLTA